MRKFTRLLTLLLFMSTATNAIAANKISINSTPALVPPPPPLKEPYDQSEYEKSLCLNEQTWLRQATQHIKSKMVDPKGYFNDRSVSFAIDKSGRIIPPLAFGMALPSSELTTMTTEIMTLSPLPRFPSRTSRVLFVHFSNGNVQIRIQLPSK